MMAGNDDKTRSETSSEAAADNRPAGEGVTHFPAAGRKKACPICGKPVKLETRPFCSKRCADIDLGRWLGETYRIPAEEPPDGFDSDSEPPPSAPEPDPRPRRR